MLMHPQADEFAQIVIDEGVKIVTTGAGNPGKYMAAWKAAGITVIPVVAAAVLARHLAPSALTPSSPRAPKAAAMWVR